MGSVVIQLYDFIYLNCVFMLPSSGRCALFLSENWLAKQNVKC